MKGCQIREPCGLGDGTEMNLEEGGGFDLRPRRLYTCCICCRKAESGDMQALRPGDNGLTYVVSVSPTARLRL